MKKWLIKLGSLLLAIIIPITVLFFVTESLDNPYKNTYLAEIADKCDRLNENDAKKIVFVGDSAMPFGLRSDMIQEQLPEYKVVNFGLYGAIGTKYMLDISKTNIQKGDVYVISPGVSKQTYSLYFDAKTILQANDGFSYRYKNLSWADNWDLFFHYFGFMKDKLNYSINKNAPDPIGIYRHDSFNEYGDIKVEREHNMMLNGYDSSTPIAMDDSLLNVEFIDYVNKYCNYIRSKGAKVYFSFAPCNQKAAVTSKNNRAAFQTKLDEMLQCDLLINVDDAIMNSGYFYDTNAHLNSTGAIVYTNLMIRSLKQKLGLSLDNSTQNDPLPPGQIEPEVIEPEEKEDVTPFEEYRGEPNNDYLDYFELKQNGSTYEITGVKTKYKGMTEVILPSTYEHKNIASIATNAFDGCVDLKTIHIGNTYQALKQGAFGGAIALQRIFFYTMDGNSINVPSIGLFEGTNRDVQVYVPVGSNFAYGYTWANYRERLVFYE